MLPSFAIDGFLSKNLDPIVIETNGSLFFQEWPLPVHRHFETERDLTIKCKNMIKASVVYRMSCLDYFWVPSLVHVPTVFKHTDFLSNQWIFQLFLFVPSHPQKWLETHSIWFLKGWGETFLKLYFIFYCILFLKTYIAAYRVESSQPSKRLK